MDEFLKYHDERLVVSYHSEMTSTEEIVEAHHCC